MACSGKSHFYNLRISSDYQHQVPETGRYDCRYQAYGDFKAPTGYVYTGPVYCYLRFPCKGVVVTKVNDWKTEATWEEGNYTYWVGKQETYTLQNGNEIGLGDLIANMDPYADQNVPRPDISFFFGYSSGTSCI